MTSLMNHFKSFGRAERLEEHLRTHTGETPFKCDICLKGFTTKHNLLRHRNIHTLEKKYTCEICFKYFADPTQHKRHQATHFAKHNKDNKGTVYYTILDNCTKKYIYR